MKYCEFENCQWQTCGEHIHCALCNTAMKRAEAGEAESEFRNVFGREPTEEEKKWPCCDGCFEKAKSITFIRQEKPN
jgi:hypothetical protein